MNRISFVLPCSVLLLTTGVFSQELGDPAAAMRSHGVVTTEGVVRGIGPDYSARFDAHGVEFTPALGVRAAQPFPVRFTLESVRRGANDVFARTRDVAPTVAGDRVRFEHGHDLAEVYDVRGDGIEQSFVFDRRPAGHGDLVVRGRITTALPLSWANDDSVRFEQEGLGGVTFGAVTGVDATGATVRGSIRSAIDGSHVEWVLPASFVEQAAYPLVLDPLIGSAFTVANTASIPDTQPAVAFDATNSRYFVVWRVDLSASLSEVRGQHVTSGGTPIGGTILFSAIGSPDVRPAVANIAYSDRFLVGYATRSTVSSPPFGTMTYDTLFVRAIDAGASVMSAPVSVAGGLFSTKPTHVTIGGDSRGVFAFSQRALVAFRTETGGGASDILVSFVTVQSGFDPVVGAATSLASSSNRLGGPVVTAHCGTGAQWLVAFGQSILAPTGPMQRIVGQRVAAATPSVAAGLCGLPFTLVGGATDIDNPAVATSDGTHFAVAWQDNQLGTVHLRTGTWIGTCAGGSVNLGSIGAPITTAGIADQPALGFAVDKFLLAWRHRATASSPGRVMGKGLDPVTCATCGVEWTLDNAAAAQETPAIASRHDGGDATNDEALLVWSNGAIRGRRFEARGDDVITAMGGGCVSGLNDYATSSGDAVLGNDSFQLVIANSVSLPLVLIVGFSAVSAPCGNCTIVPSPDILFPATNPYTLAIPCDPQLVGVDLYTQWLVLKPSTCPILPDFSFTNALRFTIGE